MEPKVTQVAEVDFEQIKNSASSKPEIGKQKYPGCFKKTIAFFIDHLIITALGAIVFFPLSDFFNSLYQHGWIPGYLISAIYFSLLESSLLKGQTIGKKIFSIKVADLKGRLIFPLFALGRYLLITIPLLNSAISESLATTIGITNTTIGGAIFLTIVGILFVGNTFFMLLHPQKRGLHDIIFGSIVVPVNYEPTDEIKNFTLKPLISSFVGFALLVTFFGNLYFNVRKNPDFSDISNLSEKIQKASSLPNISASYKTFAMNGKLTSFAIEVHVPVPYDKFDEDEYIESISTKLYSLVKTINTNPKVDTITLVFHAQKYIGVLPVSKTNKNRKKISEIK